MEKTYNLYNFHRLVLAVLTSIIAYNMINLYLGDLSLIDFLSLELIFVFCKNLFNFAANNLK